jgi:signal transduction histidine kinase
MNPEFDSLSGMIAYLREQISKLLEYSGKQYYIQMPDDYIEVNISNLKRKNISMLMKEAVNNAIKHSNATSVYVKMVLINEHLEIEIKDNGKGFDTRQITPGHGIKNYIFRSGLLNGTSNVVSNNCGTEVYFCIPLRD